MRLRGIQGMPIKEASFGSRSAWRARKAPDRGFAGWIDEQNAREARELPLDRQNAHVAFLEPMISPPVVSGSSPVTAPAEPASPKI